MTTERVIAWAVPLDSERRQLLADIRSAADRACQAGLRQPLLCQGQSARR